MKVYKVSPRTVPAAPRAKTLEAKTFIKKLWKASSDTPVSFTKDPLLKALEQGMSMYPDATIYASRACRANIVQEIMETGVPFRQYHTNFLGRTATSSIVETIDPDTPAIFVASASTKTGSCDSIQSIHDAIRATGVQQSYVHLACDDVGGILPFSTTKSLLISMDTVDSISCTSQSFGLSDSVGVLAGEKDVRDVEVKRSYINAITHDTLREISSATFACTMAMFDVLFSHRIQSYVLKESNVILVKVPECIRTMYALEVHDEWTCLRIPLNAEAGFTAAIINDIVDYYNGIR